MGLPRGTKTITASYAGDAHFAASKGSITQTVTRAARDVTRSSGSRRSIANSA